MKRRERLRKSELEKKSEVEREREREVACERGREVRWERGRELRERGKGVEREVSLEKTIEVR